MAVTSENIPVVRVPVVDEDDCELTYSIEARYYAHESFVDHDHWLIGEYGSTVSHAIYPEEIDAYIELFNAMKNYKKERGE